MQIVIDLETKNIAPGRNAPPVVCGVLAREDDYDNPTVYEWARLRPLVREVIKDPKTVLVNQNVFFDLAVICNEEPDLLPAVFRMFDEDRVYDTQVAQQLIAIATGDKRNLIFGLDKLTKRWLGVDLTGKKGLDVWRTRYHELIGIPIEEYPEEAARYVADDRIALRVANAQKAFVRKASGGQHDVLPTFGDQMRAAWAFYLMGCWGAQVDPDYLGPLAKVLEAHVSEVTKKLVAAGIYRENGTENKKEVKRRVAEDYGTKQPLPKGMETLSPRDLWEVLKNDSARLNLHKNCMTLSKRAMTALDAGTEHPLTEAELAGLRWPFTIQYPKEVPLTENDGVKVDTETLADATDPILQLRADVSGDKKLLETYVPLLSAGTRLPINPRWNVLVDSGRSSCGKPNLQNQPRKPGVRECFVPHEGCVFVACDYAVAELRSLAQVLLKLFGWSKMADAVREGKDLHLVFVSMLMNEPYADVEARKKDPLVKKMRNLAKAMNFGVPGGLGAEKFVRFAKASYGIHIAEYAPETYWPMAKPADLDGVENDVLLDVGIRYFKEVLKPLWLDTYPEMQYYFKHIGMLCAGEDAATVTHPLTGYIRGGVFYCAACNQNFQHLTAMGAKKALYEVVRECYVDCGTDLYGCRPFAFIHDEIILEAPEWLAQRAADRLEVVMAEAMQVYTPDVPVGTDASIMRRWRKGAEGSGVWEDRDLTPKEVGVIKGADDLWSAAVLGGVEMARAKEIRGE